MQFDPSKGFGEVHGIVGVRYEQGGHLFAHNGAEVRIVTVDGDEVAEVIGEPLSVPVSELIAVPERKPEGGLNDRHWREIKALVEINGGAWTNKQDGVKFLEGRA